MTNRRPLRFGVAGIVVALSVVLAVPRVRRRPSSRSAAIPTPTRRASTPRRSSRTRSPRLHHRERPQVGRIFDGGATAIGWATSTDGGSSWTPGSCPASPSTRAEVRTTASAIRRSPTTPSTTCGWRRPCRSRTAGGPRPSRSVDRPTAAPPGRARSRGDRVAASTRTGSCATTGRPAPSGAIATCSGTMPPGRLMQMSTSTDGGLTWSAPAATAGHGPWTRRSAGRATRRDGGRPVHGETASRPSPPRTAVRTGAPPSPSPASAITPSPVGLRTALAALGRGRRRRKGVRRLAGLPLPRPVRVQRHRLQHVDDGNTWTPVTRIPIDPVEAAVDHFIPGIGVDSETQGCRCPPRAHLPLLPEVRTAVSTLPAPGRVRLLDGRGREWTGHNAGRADAAAWLPKPPAGG